MSAAPGNPPPSAKPAGWIPDEVRPFIAPFCGLVLLLGVAAVAMLRAPMTPARGITGGFVLLLVLPVLGVFTAASMARVGSGPRHFMNYHYLFLLPGLGAGWLFASEGFGFYAPWFLGLATVASGVGAAQIVASLTIQRRAAMAIAALVATLFFCPLRPFHPAVLNLLFPLLAAAFAWLTATALHTSVAEGDPLRESSPAAALPGYLVFNLVGLAVLLPILAVALKAVVTLIITDKDADSITLAMTGETTGVPWSFLAARLIISGVTALLALVIAAWRSLPSARPSRAAFAALLAGLGPLLGGQPLSGEGIIVATLGALLVAIGVGLGCAGGVSGRRAPRPLLAAMIAAWLALNLFEPRAVPAPISGPWTMVPILLEGLWLLAISWVGYHWGVRGLRAQYPELAPPSGHRTDGPMPPPPPPGRLPPWPGSRR